MHNIKIALNHWAAPGEEPKWYSLMSEMLAMGFPLTEEEKTLIEEILKFEGELQLDEESEMPHRMSPENMLKNFANRILEIEHSSRVKDDLGVQFEV